MNCIFCEILYGTAEAEIVYDGIATLGIVPLNPVTEGHMIFMPRKHARDAAEEPAVTASVMGDTGDTARYIQHLRTRAGSNSPDFNIITSIGPAATQTVFHLHVHVVPRTVNDGLALPWYSGKTASNTKWSNTKKTTNFPA